MLNIWCRGLLYLLFHENNFNWNQDFQSLYVLAENLDWSLGQPVYAPQQLTSEN